MRAVLFCVVTQRVVVICYRRFGTTYGVPSSGGQVFKMGLIGCPETSVRNYHYSLRNNPEEHSYLFIHISFEEWKLLFFCGTVWPVYSFCDVTVPLCVMLLNYFCYHIWFVGVQFCLLYELQETAGWNWKRQKKSRAKNRNCPQQRIWRECEWGSNTSMNAVFSRDAAIGFIMHDIKHARYYM